jgi:dUTP pyrophosphatase
MFRAGSFVAERLSPVAPDQVQPNGVDLTVGGVERVVEPGRIGRDGKTIGRRESVDPVPAAAPDADDEVPTYRLDPGAYACVYGETVRIPDSHVGFVYPRSSLMRNGSMLHTAVWDAGYEGRGEGLLVVHRPIEVVRGARIAQLVLAEAAHEGTYDGDYQGERA